MKRVLLLLLLALVLLAFGLVGWLLHSPELQLRLARQWIPEPWDTLLHWQELQWGREEASLSGLTLDGFEHSLGKASLHQPLAIWRGQLPVLTLEDLALYADYHSTEGRWDIPLPPLPASEASPDLPTLPPVGFRLKNARFHLRHDGHVTQFSLNGELNPDCTGELHWQWEGAAPLPLAPGLTLDPLTDSTPATLQDTPEGCRIQLPIPTVTLHQDKDQWRMPATVLEALLGPDSLRLTLTPLTVDHRPAKAKEFSPQLGHSTLHLAVTKTLDHQWQAAGKLTDATGKLTLFLAAQPEADHDGAYLLEASLPPTEFQPGILEPGWIAPPMRELVRDASGTARLRAQYRPAQATPLTLDWQFTSFSVNLNDTPIRAISAGGSLTGLPLKTPATQSLSIGEITLGLPLRNGTVRYSLNWPNLTLQPSQWQWAGGGIGLDKAVLNLDKPLDLKSSLHIQSIQLDALAAAFLPGELATTGSLSGDLPFHFKGGKLRLTTGTLHADKPGSIRYQAAPDSAFGAVRQDQVALLRDALANFQYDELKLTLSSHPDTPEKLTASLNISGRNPDLYDGRPIKLNVNLTGNLLDILGQGMTAAAMPKQLEDQLKKQLQRK